LKSSLHNPVQVYFRLKLLFRSRAQPPKTTQRTPKRDAPCVYCLKYLLKHEAEEIFTSSGVCKRFFIPLRLFREGGRTVCVCVCVCV
jgi:hypothetical protein